MSKSMPNLVYRRPNGTLGPFLNEGQISGLLSLLKDQVAPAERSFPDLMPAIASLHKIITDGFEIQAQKLNLFIVKKEEEDLRRQLAKNYERLFNQWNYARSVEDPRKKESQWDKVVDQACDMLIDLREALPIEKDIDKWSESLADKVEQIGRMYTEALLFIIYGRAEYEPVSLLRDPRPRQYSGQIKDIITSFFDGENQTKLLLSAAFHQKKHYQKVANLSGLNTKLEADAFLFRNIQSITPVRIDDPNALFSHYMEDVQDAYSRTIRSERYHSQQWHMVCVLWELYRKVCRLEALIEALEKQESELDSNASAKAAEIISAVLDERVTLLDI